MQRPLLKELSLKIGKSGATTLDVPLTSFTIFVGPNNAGKSLVLQELEHSFSSSHPPLKMISRVVPSVPTLEEAQAFIDERSFEINADLQPVFGRVDPSGNLDHLYGRHEGSARELASRSEHDADLLRMMAGASFARLDGQTRLNLARERTVEDLQDRPKSHLHLLFVDDSLRGRFRGLIHEAFGLYPVLDPTHMGRIRLRMAQRPPADSAEERNWDQRAVAFHNEATLMTDMSDGVKAYTGIVMTLLGFNYRVLLIDEPEAFLHPPLARRLGRTIGQLTTQSGMNVFASTHSADFLFGAVQSGADVQVIRLTYSPPTGGTARLLPAAQLEEWMRDPMLRSTGVLSALFHRSVVVCEGDSDRPFYQEVNERLTTQSRGAPDTLFLSGYGKGNIKRLLPPLRAIGIPAAAIVDLDIIKRNELTDLLNTLNVPKAVVSGIGALKGRMLETFQRLDDKYPSARAGAAVLTRTDDLEACSKLLQDCAEYGVFLCPWWRR